MKRTLLALALALPVPALAQQTPEQQTAYAVMLPMFQEMLPGYQGQVLASCALATATPEETAQIAAAGAPSEAVAPVINAIVARPEILDCVKATMQQ